MSGRLVLVRHGQSHANVARLLDTRPPGAELTDLGRQQARMFARDQAYHPGLLVHSGATRAIQTAAEIATLRGLAGRQVDGIHEVQVGELENRADDAAHEEFTAIYRRWHLGELDAALPGGETGAQVLDRYLPVLGQLRRRYLDDEAWDRDVIVVSHGAAIRLVGAVIAGVEADFALTNHLDNTAAVVLAPITDGRWSCLRWGSATPPFDVSTPVAAQDAPAGSSDPMG